ncbi:MAG: DUF924 domain-containing protein [Sandaracinaceae bacterium]|nr:DUF924 domain-containing protein [Sandaracinaceae bacterium]
MSDIENVLTYWFGDRANPHPDDFMNRIRRWFAGGLEIDREISETFGRLLSEAQDGKLADWAQTPRGRLALIIVLDQFSRNVYRGEAQAFAQDAAARALTIEGVELGADNDYGLVERMFFNMPLVHAEDLALQDRAVAYLEGLKGDDTASDRGMLDSATKAAIEHRDIIRKFGRFPARNKALGRSSTPEEDVFLREQAASNA